MHRAVLTHSSVSLQIITSSKRSRILLLHSNSSNSHNRLIAGRAKALFRKIIGLVEPVLQLQATKNDKTQIRLTKALFLCNEIKLNLLLI